ncbi:MAG: tRNA pseudouridine(55) synthase TruB [Halanaerobiales bacterium]|nr:tRNA pseudouridine(55) synthase TruB [Halanaerobiales bacterium]
MSEPFGIVNLIKPPAITSFQAVAFLKRKLGCKKAGHTGTLDPAASGVLPICLGPATRLIPFLPENEKEYVAEITLGTVTDTLDAQGKIVARNKNWQHLTTKEIEEVINSCRGKIEQLPPMFSAVHYQGKRLYQLAREGKVVQRQPRSVEIFKIKLLGIDLPRLRLRLSCSKGTYVRSLADDIGKKLGSGGYLSFLVRSRSGPFRLDDGVTIEELENAASQYVLPADLFLDYRRLILKKKAERKAKSGIKLSAADLLQLPEDLTAGDKVLLFTSENVFISINEIIKDREGNFAYKPLRVFNL